MPLIQWIMQNLSATSPQFGGVVAGGEAVVGIESFIIGKGQVLASGDALYQKIASIITTGGVVAAGDATVEKQSGAKTTRKIRHLPGDVIYDRSNKPWVVVSFEFATSSTEAQYKVTDTAYQKYLYDSQVTEVTSDYSDYLELEVVRKIDALLNLPMPPVGNTGATRILRERGMVTRYYKDATLSPEKIINELQTKPLDNLPTYAGRRTIKV